MNRKNVKKLKKKSINANYIFTIKKIGRKKMEQTIQIPGTLNLGEFDREIRIVMNFDAFDHLSAFYDGEPYRSIEIATITPNGDGDNSDVKINQMGLKEGIEFGYVYDFGDNIQCSIKLNEILPV